MRYFLGLFVWILIASGNPVALSQQRRATANELDTSGIRIKHDVLAENQRMRDIFLDVLRGTGVHGGIAEIEGCSELPKGDLKLKRGSTLNESMNALVAANPNYQWDLDEGVINLMPRGGVPLLETMIAKFQIDRTDREIPAALHDLLRLPEVREHEAALRIKQGLGQGGPGAIPKHPVPRKNVPVQINVQGLSLRQAFNKIVRASQQAVWIYHETDCNGEKKYTLDVVSNY